MGCCIAAALIASQGLTLSSRVRDFLGNRLGFAHFCLSYGVVAIIATAEILMLGALAYAEFGFGSDHARHLFSIVNAANIFNAPAADFAICRGR